MSQILSFWTKASPKRKRLYSLIFIFILSVVVTLAGTLVPMSEEDANEIYEQISGITENQDLPSLTGIIFANNFLLCLIMFIPVFGTVFGFFTLFSTGAAIGAISMVQEIPVLFQFLVLVITPIFWIEFISYSIGISSSIWLFRRLTQKRWRELKWTAIGIGTTAALLAIGAVVEAWIILAASA